MKLTVMQNTFSCYKNIKNNNMKDAENSLNQLIASYHNFFDKGYKGDNFSNYFHFEMKKIIYEIITEKQKDITLEDHYIFIQKLLYFWSGLTQYNKMKDYNISYQISYDTNGDLINKERFPEAHTCFYILDIYRFPDELVSFNNRKDFVYNKLRTAVFNTIGMDKQ